MADPLSLIRTVFLLLASISLVSPRCCSAAENRVDFSTQIRPLLNKNCTSCHGGVKLAGDVSFIYEEQVLESGIIEPGDPENSDLIYRITTDDPDIRMPPVDEHPEPLSQEEIDLLTRWIEQGASWESHWAYSKPSKHTAPQNKNDDWANRELDRFILARLEQEQLHPSPAANPAEWLRRVSFDLIGLPPTTEELEHFLRACESSPDEIEQAYEAEVDRLLASPHFGERWASLWLDLARYADSQGYEKDRHRHAWPFRDWVIAAFNEDMPFNEFTLKQIAGDLLPNPTAGDLIATLFHRNTQTNDEGGTDDEQYRVEAVIDRINSTWTVWLGGTFGCVQCHSHPYDPFRHEEYYKFMAFFNNTADHDLGDDFPTLKYPESPDKHDPEEAVTIQRKHQQLRKQLNTAGVQVAEACDDWQALTPANATSSHGQLEINENNQVHVAGGTIPVGAVYQISFPAKKMQALKIDIFPSSDNPLDWPERGSVLSQLKLKLVLPDGTSHPVKIHEVIADHLAGPYDPNASLQGHAPGFGGYPKLVGPRWAVFVLAEPLDPPAGSTLQADMFNKASTNGGQSVHLRRFAFSSSAAESWPAFISSPERQQQRQELRQLATAESKIPGVPVPIMQPRDDSASRPTHVFIRGNWMTHGDQVSADTPQKLHELPDENPSRVELAEWLVDAENPLTARVLANRLWAELFGIGLVETQENFGSTGTPPSHPALLDHLAIKLQHEQAWHIKPFLRDLVLSSTYRQSNRITPELLERDPRNRLLARGPRTRLTAEMVRDQALVVADKLNTKIGGPSVMPPQPDGVWQTVYSGAKWQTATGPDRYRRALYTYWRRTSPYPSFMTFDAPSRDVCSPRRLATNTPLQALVTLNDPVYVELSEHFAQRMQTVVDSTPADWIHAAYRAATQQEPSEDTLGELLALYEATLDEYTKADPAAENKQTALSVVTNTILNLDEALVK